MVYSKVAIIGTGNLATHLSKFFEKKGFRVSEVYGRNLDKTRNLASKLYDCNAVSDLDFSESEATLFFLCVSDESISELAEDILLPEGSILLHCSGATSLMAIAREDSEFGVFYPIQTFSSNRKISFENLPICIEANTEEAENILEKLVLKLGAQPYFMNSEQRLTLHLSAVFACNFTNHFYRIAKDLLKSKGLPFDLLGDLIHETTDKALEFGPENVQTGPAIRDDQVTLTKHQLLLKKKAEWKLLYQKISEDILRLKE